MGQTRTTTSAAAAPSGAAKIAARKRFAPEAIASKASQAVTAETERMLGILRAIGPFRYLPSSRLIPLAERGRLATFEPGTDLVRQDEVADRIYVIASGQVRVGQSHPHLTEPLVLAELGPGEVIGEMGVLSGRPCSATVTAVEPTEALELSAAELPQALRLVPEVSDILIRILGRRLRRTDAIVDSELKLVDPAAEPLPDSIEQGVCQVDLFGRVTLANLAATRLIGYKTAELLGRDFHALIHPSRHGCSEDDCPVYADLHQYGMDPAEIANPSEARGAEPREERDEAFWRRDGSSFPASYTTEAHYEEDEIVGTTVCFRRASEQSRDDEYDLADSGDRGAHRVEEPLPLAVGCTAR